MLSANASELSCKAAAAKSLTAKSGSLALANVPELMLLAEVVSVVADAAKPLTAPLAIAISTLLAAVRRPSASTVNVATESASPYVAAVTVVAVSSVGPTEAAVILISPELKVIPEPPLKCALASVVHGLAIVWP